MAPGQIYRDRGSALQLAVNNHGSTGAMCEAIDLRQAQASTLLHFLGCEEGSNTFERMFAGIPEPVSVTLRTTKSPDNPSGPLTDLSC